MIKALIIRAMAVVVFAGTFAALGGCNTVAGAGQDIQDGGRAIKNEAREHQN